MSLRIFTRTSKVIWFLTMLSLCLIEAIPFYSDNVAPPLFYTYKAIKGLLFVVFGFQMPLAFWRFDSIRAGLLLSLLSAFAVECFQNLSPGHVFSLVELLLKGALIMFGFIIGFNPRHDHQLSVLGLNVSLIPSQKA